MKVLEISKKCLQLLLKKKLLKLDHVIKMNKSQNSNWEYKERVIIIYKLIKFVESIFQLRISDRINEDFQKNIYSLKC